MTIEYKATVQHKDGRVIPIVDEYRHGEYKRSLTFADAPKFEDIFMAFNYAKTEADELNRRVHYEKR